MHNASALATESSPIPPMFVLQEQNAAAAAGCCFRQHTCTQQQQGQQQQDPATGSITTPRINQQQQQLGLPTHLVLNTRVCHGVMCDTRDTVDPSSSMRLRAAAGACAAAIDFSPGVRHGCRLLISLSHTHSPSPTNPPTHAMGHTQCHSRSVTHT